MPVNILDSTTEYAGAMRTRILHLEIDGYDEDGEPFGKDEMGVNRIQHVSITPDGAAFSAGYDFDENVLVTDLADGENARVSMVVIGR